MVEEVNGVKVLRPGPSGVFISLPFDDGILFISSADLLDWVKEEKNKFQIFISVNSTDVAGINVANSYSQYISRMINEYYSWYEKLLTLAREIQELQDIAGKAILDTGIEEKKKKFVHTCTEFSNAGFFPMQSSVGMAAMAMSRVQANLQKNDSHELPDLPQSIAWLYAMTVLRKQQSKQEKAAADVKLNVEAGRDQLNSLQKDIEEAQAKVVRYKGELEEFQKNALKSAALKSPADALGGLEKAHRNTALGYFGLIAAIVSVWISFVIFCYYPSYVKPLLDKAKDAPLEAGAMILTSMVFTGIVLTVVIILLRLAVSRINFSIAAGERKAVAAAYRALLDENAIPKDQQLVFLQGIVGGNFPGYVDSNRIPTIQDSLGTAARNLSGGTARG